MEKTMLNLTEAARIMQLSRQRMQQLCAKNRIPGARKNGAHWEIPQNVLLKFKKNRTKLRYAPPKGVINATRASSIIGLSTATVCKYCVAGYIFGARKVGKNWEIPIDAFQNFKKRRDAARNL